MAFKQIRAFWVRYSPRTSKIKHVDVAPQTAPVNIGHTLQRSSLLDKNSASQWTTDDDSWDGEPPRLYLDPFDKRDPIQPVTIDATRDCRKSSAPAQPHIRRHTIAANAHLRAVNHDLAEHVDRLEQDLSRKHTTLAELESELELLWDTANEHQKTSVQLEDENATLAAQVKLLSTSRWRPMRQLQERLLEVESRARLAEHQVAQMKVILGDAVRDRRELREEAYELWDAILNTGVQPGALNRADRALHRLSIRFDFEDWHN